MKVLPSLVLASALIAGSSIAQPYGSGPGMMWGGGGYGMGPGMMGEGPEYGGGWGGRMGRGMMWGGPGYSNINLNLDKSQQDKIDKIERAADKARWTLMGTMREQAERMHDAFDASSPDDANARKVYAEMEGTRKAMFDLNLATRKEIYEVLTPEQRSKLGRRASP